MSLDEIRFWSHVNIPSGPHWLKRCWEWRGCLTINPDRGPAGGDSSGYGKFAAGGKTYRAHRFAWERYHRRKLRPEEYIGHVCNNRRCVNPRHLEVVSPGENLAYAHACGRTNGKQKGYAPGGFEE